MKYQRHKRSVYYLEWWYIWVVVVGGGGGGGGDGGGRRNGNKIKEETHLISVLLDVLTPSLLYV